MLQDLVKDNTPRYLAAKNVNPLLFNHQQPPAIRIDYNFPVPLNQHLRHNQQSQIVATTADTYARSQYESKACTIDEFTCSSPHQCISNGKRCDGQVNCVDGSDEKGCSCTSRLNENQMFDNYYDCPDGEDERNLTVCHFDSCGPNTDQCYTSEEKCDGVENCLNGKDESECSFLLPKINSTPHLLPRSTEGFLFRSFKNNLYPVCNDPLRNWALAACEVELGIHLSAESISISYVPAVYSGKYISYRDGDMTKIFTNNCTKDEIFGNALLQVECPRVCGTVTNSRNNNLNQMRIAGGREAAAGSHPWLVGIYLNGTFHCGGSIIEKDWVKIVPYIVTSAHCVHYKGKQLTQYDYLEVRAGILRPRSFSPHEQTIRVMRFLSHPKYNSTSLTNDIALLELGQLLTFNRWVNSICLPSQELINKTDANWMWRPEENTICSTAGWGGFTHRGPFKVDNLMEVELPVVRGCNENNTDVLCAGYANGGLDTCRGDSGGPFSCRSNTNRTQFYLAGITSSGYNPSMNSKQEYFCGEPNTFTTFTRTAFMIEWIAGAKSRVDTDGTWLRYICPGVICQTISRCVKKLDGIVDCLDGEDETKIIEKSLH